MLEATRRSFLKGLFATAGIVAANPTLDLAAIAAETPQAILPPRDISFIDAGELWVEHGGVRSLIGLMRSFSIEHRSRRDLIAGFDHGILCETPRVIIDVMSDCSVVDFLNHYDFYLPATWFLKNPFSEDVCVIESTGFGWSITIPEAGKHIFFEIEPRVQSISVVSSA